MAAKPDILIHTALFNEAKPIIQYFGLKQYETHPFKIFRGGRILLIVSGVGGENSLKALELVITGNRFKMALNIGTAGCNDTQFPIGMLLSVKGGPKGLAKLPLITSDIPVQTLPSGEPSLVDMEGRYFLESLKPHVSDENIHILKIVADHLDDTVLGAGDLEKLLADSIPFWKSMFDKHSEEYSEKIEEVIRITPFENLDAADQIAIREAALFHNFSHQELKQIIEMALDFDTWDEAPIHTVINKDAGSRKEAFRFVKTTWEDLKATPKSYRGFNPGTVSNAAPEKRTAEIKRDSPGFGRCPVASERTRCCNLLTLDAIEGCGFDCSYCSIRYFYDGDVIGIDKDFPEKLKSIEIDPGQRYHIGTGQSSDSLMWGNKDGILDAVLDFAGNHPNVILELKTKSDNIGHLLSRDIPPNVLTTWSLNTNVIIESEEHHTASLERRLRAAEQMAAKGGLIGFHLHPLVNYDEWKTDYSALSELLTRRFRPEDVAMVSLGTLTFIKPVIKKMRARNIKSKILQMPLVDAEGKFSYPMDAKREMFSFVYELFTDWHDKVFFYLCMEDAGLWKDVFGFEYPDNEAFEKAMIDSYEGKIDEKRHSHR